MNPYWQVERDLGSSCDQTAHRCGRTVSYHPQDSRCVELDSAGIVDELVAVPEPNEDLAARRVRLAGMEGLVVAPVASVAPHVVAEVQCGVVVSEARCAAAAAAVLVDLYVVSKAARAVEAVLRAASAARPADAGNPHLIGIGHATGSIVHTVGEILPVGGETLHACGVHP